MTPAHTTMWRCVGIWAACCEQSARRLASTATWNVQGRLCGCSGLATAICCSCASAMPRICSHACCLSCCSSAQRHAKSCVSAGLAGCLLAGARLLLMLATAVAAAASALVKVSRSGAYSGEVCSSVSTLACVVHRSSADILQAATQHASESASSALCAAVMQLHNQTFGKASPGHEPTRALHHCAPAWPKAALRCTPEACWLCQRGWQQLLQACKLRVERRHCRCGCATEDKPCAPAARCCRLCCSSRLTAIWC